MEPEVMEVEKIEEEVHLIEPEPEFEPVNDTSIDEAV